MFSCFGVKKLVLFDSFCEVKEVLFRNWGIFNYLGWGYEE